MGYFEFDGRRSDDLGLHIQYHPDYPTPERLGEDIIVPGRNGIMRISTGAYGNVAAQFDTWFKGGAQQAHGVKSWLLASEGYCRLSDSYDPGHFRMAQFLGPLDIENTLGRVGRCNLEFTCKPQVFLTLGETPSVFAASGTLENPEAFPARPMTRVYGTGTVTINGYACKINSSDEYTDLDSEIRQAFKDGFSCNDKVLVPEFPVLGAGTNNIVLDGNITRVEITPRWWTV